MIEILGVVDRPFWSNMKNIVIVTCVTKENTKKCFRKGLWVHNCKFIKLRLAYQEKSKSTRRNAGYAK